jgi:intraflagellar transport protein 46
VLHNQRADEAVDLSDHSMEGSVNSAELSQHLQHTHADSDSPASHSQYNRKVASPMAMPPSASAARQQHDAFAHDDEFQGNEFQGNEFGGNEFNNDQFRGQEFDHGTYGNDEQRWQGDSDEDMVPAMGGDVHIGGSGPTGLYNPDEFHNLNASVAPEIRDLFDYIGRYKAHDIELEAKLKPFIPDYIPAIGEIDSFVKVPRPDDKTDTLGLQVLDEPASRQSDPTSLDLFLRLHAKQAHLTPVAVRSIEFADKNPKKVAAWISNVQDVHRQKPPPTVHYSKPMPEIEQLMQVWPQDFEEALKEVCFC